MPLPSSARKLVRTQLKTGQTQQKIQHGAAIDFGAGKQHGQQGRKKSKAQSPGDKMKHRQKGDRFKTHKQDEIRQPHRHRKPQALDVINQPFQTPNMVVRGNPQWIHLP